MRKILIFFLLYTVNSIPQTGYSLKLNEIMFYPSSGNNEFIEIYNTSAAESINLEGFRIKYYTASADIITDAGEGTVLDPRSYAVILEGDYDPVSGIYNNLIPAGALVLRISDNSFGSTGMSNTSDRPVWLISPSDDTIDVYIYSADNTQAHSDEKIHFESDSSQVNWLNSIPVNGTPGFINSVTPLTFDLEIGSIFISPEIPVEGDNVLIEASIINQGENTADNFSVGIFNDTNLDSIPQSGEQIYYQDYFNLSPGDSVSAYTNIPSAASGLYNIIVKAFFTPDEDTSNNTGCRNFNVYTPGTEYNDVVINEIMYAPSSDQPEWVEIYNRTMDPVNLKNWTFSDNSTTKIISGHAILIPSGSFAVLTEDSSVLNYYSVPCEIIEFSLPSLNNTGDAVVIKDSLGFVIDSLFYVPGWGGSTGGRSLERRSADDPSVLQSNWSTSESIFMATPGNINSVKQKDNDLKISSFRTSNDYGIIGETVQFKVLVKNAGLNLSPDFSLSLFYDVNRDSIPQYPELVLTLNLQPLLPGDSSELIISTESFEEGVNYFISKLTVSPDDDTTNNTAYRFFTGIIVGETRNDLIVNEFMYDPDASQPEWIEIFNRSDESLNLKNHKIADSHDTVKVISNDMILLPGDYTVISSDSTIINYFNVQSSIIIKTLPALNNSGDKIILLDSLNRVIDSLEYSSGWGGTDGRSLERMDIGIPSEYSENWRTSISRYNGTPGYINSVTPKDYDICVQDIIPSPLYPVIGDNVYLKIKVKNPGLASASYSIKLYEDTGLDSIPDLLLVSLNDLALSPGDSSVIETGYLINSLNNTRCYYAEAVYNSDEDTSNNYIFKIISPGFSPSAILINEIMYNPAPGEPEWFEIVNNSSDSINLKNWSVSDLLNTPTINFITGNDYYIKPEQFMVVASDTSFYSYHPGVTDVFITNFGTLGNAEDGIILYDFRDAVIDSVHYYSKWGGNKGYSLEKFTLTGVSGDSSNWSSSLDPGKSTPGQVNSVVNIPAGIRNSVVINEIMSDPGIDNCEFLEFYNNSPESINIGGWRIEDEKGNSYKLCDISFYIDPEEYFILAADSVLLLKYSLGHFPNISISGTSDLGLSNSGEAVILKDVRGNLIDSVCYSSAWHNRNINITKNKSLERINPGLDGNNQQNWSTSVSAEGATPGRQNSIFTDNNNRQTSISVSPNPFSPDNDGFEDFCIINFNLSQPTSQIRIKVFDNRGRLVRTIANNQPSGSQGSVIFDGLGDDGQILRMGIYIIFLEALNANSGVVDNLKTVVVVARRL